jgi:hypothetical protein
MDALATPLLLRHLSYSAGKDVIVSDHAAVLEAIGMTHAEFVDF